MGFGLALDRRLIRYLAVGGGLQLTMLTIPYAKPLLLVANFGVRLAGVLPITQQFEAYALVSPAYSVFFGTSDQPSGFLVGLAAGALFRPKRRVGLFLELSYNHGAQRRKGKQQATRYFDVGFGVSFGF